MQITEDKIKALAFDIICEQMEWGLETGKGEKLAYNVDGIAMMAHRLIRFAKAVERNEAQSETKTAKDK